MAHSLRFYGDGVSFWLSLAVSSDSGSFLVARTSLSGGGFQREGFWEVGRAYPLLPLRLGPSLFLPVSFRQQHPVLYQDLLLRDNSGKRLSLCLAKAGSFSQWFPNLSSLTQLFTRHLLGILHVTSSVLGV